MCDDGLHAQRRITAPTNRLYSPDANGIIVQWTRPVMAANVRDMILRVLLFVCAALPAAGDSHLTPMLPLPEDQATDWPAIGRVYDPNDPDRGF
ncbi:MAG: hypothetical protein AAFS01_09215, partial [Pseudomonadota bacterium]